MKVAWLAEPRGMEPARCICASIDLSRRSRRYAIILLSLTISLPVSEALTGVPSFEISCLMIQSPISWLYVEILMKIGSMLMLAFLVARLARKSNYSLILSIVSFWLAMTLSADENSP